MLCPAALRSLLNQANTGSVGSTLLINRDGSVLAHSGSTSDRHAIVTAAVASNAWGAYEKAGRVAHLASSSPSSSNAGSKNRERGGPRANNSFSSDDSAKGDNSALRYILLDCTEGRAGLALVPGTDLIVSVFADSSCELGLLKKKVLALAEYLEEPLGQMLSEHVVNA